MIIFTEFHFWVDSPTLGKKRSKHDKNFWIQEQTGVPKFNYFCINACAIRCFRKYSSRLEFLISYFFSFLDHNCDQFHGLLFSFRFHFKSNKAIGTLSRLRKSFVNRLNTRVRMPVTSPRTNTSRSRRQMSTLSVR